MSFTLKSNETTVSVNVKKYSDDNPIIVDIKRIIESKAEHIIRIIISIVCIPLLIALILELILMALLCIILKILKIFSEVNKE